MILPLPEEVALLGAGYLIRQQGGSITLALTVAILPVLFGDVLTFLVGRYFLAQLLGSRLGRRLVKPSLREWSERFVRRHRVVAIGVARFLIQLRGPVYLALGDAGGSLARFLFADTLVALVEVSLTFFIGYAFGASEITGTRLRIIYPLVALAMIAAAAVPALVIRHNRRASEARV